MNQPRPARSLKVAWSLFWGVATLVLVVLWVRSYWHGDGIETQRLHKRWLVASCDGGVSIGWSETTYGGRDRQWGYIHEQPTDCHLPPSFFGFRCELVPGNSSVVSLYWFPVAIAAAVATIPWVSWSTRFSLRTLFIATTLVAAVLGWIVWVSR